MSTINAGDEVYVTKRSNQWVGRVGTVTRTSPGAMETQVVVTFDGFREVFFYLSDVKKVVKR